MKQKKFHQKNLKLLILNNKKAISGGGLLGIVFGIAAFWIILKYLLIGGVVGITGLTASPLLLLAIILFVVYWISRKK